MVSKPFLFGELPKVEYWDKAVNTHALGHIMHIEHGQDASPFCADYPRALEDLPLGYFITRLAATADARKGGHTPTRQEIVAGLLDAGAEWSGLPGAVLHAIAAHAGVSDTDPILMPPDLWGGESTTIRDLEEYYRDLIDDWSDYSGFKLGVGLASELGHLEPYAGLTLASTVKTCVLGHTHVPVLSSLPFKRRYVNAGAWCNPVPTYVVLDGDSCTLCEWR